MGVDASVALPASVGIELERATRVLDAALGARSGPVLSDALLELRGRGASAGLLDAVVRHATALAPRLDSLAGFAAWLTAVREVAEQDAACAMALLESSQEVLRHGPPAELLMWARLGLRHGHARARRDGEDARLAHFRLRSRESALIMSPHGQAVDLASSTPRLGHLLRALFDLAPPILPIEHALATTRPFLSNLGLHMPEAGRALRGAQALCWYDAAAAHAAAHLCHSTQRFSRGSLKPIQIALLGLLEDARVERLAGRELPGLRRLWLGFHVAGPAHGATFVVLMLRLARGLLDPAYIDPHPWVAKARELFERAWLGAATPGEIDPVVLRDMASRLGNDIGQMRLQFNARDYVVEPAYRDDNAYLWLAPDDAQAQLRQIADVLPLPTEDSGKALPGAALVPAPAAEADDESLLARHRYPEWDRLAATYRPDWCSVIECRPPIAAPEILARAFESHAALLARLQRVLHVHRRRERVRLRAQIRGSDLDIEAAVRSAIDRRSGHSRSDKVYLRVDHHQSAVAALLLLDTSTSTGACVESTGRSVLDLAREAAALTGLTLEHAGDRCAIHGFCSNGRHEVRYESFKEFDEAFDVHCLGRLAGMRSRLSTRFGAALRHATSVLAAERCEQRLLLLITDGEPHDIDIFDKRYLIEDARRSVREAARRGIGVFCVTLDPSADSYVRDIFGVGGFRVLDRVEALPDVLPAVVMRLTRRIE
jgi:nitric oxide reductase NorD protein